MAFPRSRLTGSIPALVTPIRNGAIDEACFAQLVERQIAEGSLGLVPCGTTGESPTLSAEEKLRLIGLTVEVAAGRVPVIAGTGSNATAETIAFTRAAQDAGADAAMIVTPYYNKPTQDQLHAHYAAIAAEVGIPIVIYNVPGRTAVDMGVDCMARLSRLPAIVGVKDATANLARASLQRAACGPEFVMLSGEDATALGFNAHGGSGCISVTANVAPKLCAELQRLSLAGDFAGALAIQDRLMPLHDALFCETSPGPVKFALSLLGLCGEEMRLPMQAPIADASKARVRAAMASAGLL